VSYYIDGALIAAHTRKYYPAVPMSINCNLWLVQGGELPAGRLRRYHDNF
jgi:hypothetical protein